MRARDEDDGDEDDVGRARYDGENLSRVQRPNWARLIL